jgi:hypothetical protein
MSGHSLGDPQLDLGRAKTGVLIEDFPLQLRELGCWLEADLFGEAASARLEGGESLRLSP